MKTVTTLILCFCVLTSFCQKENASEIVSRTFIYKKVGNVLIHADVFKVYGDSLPSPVILWIHGGALMFGSRKDIPIEQIKLYTDYGFTIVAIDYRLAPETKLSEIFSDITDAIRWIHEIGKDSLSVDPSNLFVIAHSAGGYLAMLSGYLGTYKPKAIVSFYGYGSILEDWYNKPDSFALTQKLISKEHANNLIGDSTITKAEVNERLDLYFYSRQQGNWPSLISGHDITSKGEWFKLYCPVLHIYEEYPPTLLLHGSADVDVPIQESYRLFEKLELLNNGSKLITITNSGHLFDIKEGGLSNEKIRNLFIEVLSFLERHKN